MLIPGGRRSAFPVDSDLLNGADAVEPPPDDIPARCERPDGSSGGDVEDRVVAALAPSAGIPSTQLDITRQPQLSSPPTPISLVASLRAAGSCPVACCGYEYSPRLGPRATVAATDGVGGQSDRGDETGGPDDGPPCCCSGRLRGAVWERTVSILGSSMSSCTRRKTRQGASGTADTRQQCR